jgi:CelD/BcsL family acetyltransferase involved in cellulose biosynthesis
MLQVNCIRTFSQLDALEADWRTIYCADSQAQVFLSWQWLRGWLPVSPYSWMVLAVRIDENSPYVGFFPLVMDRLGLFRFYRQLRLAGYPKADYGGWVCLPDWEDQAIEAFAHYLQTQIKWESFCLTDVFDDRLKTFLSHFPEHRYITEQTQGTVCPHIVGLPDDWDQYLQDFLGYETRRTLRKRMRQVAKLERYRLTSVNASNLQAQIETLLTLSQMRWGKQSQTELEQFRSIFSHAFQQGCLWLDVMWSGEEPIAAIAAYIDPQKSRFYAYIIGYNPKFSKLSPGRAIFGHSIAAAIDQKLQTYDFLRGAGDYKVTFGAIDRFNQNAFITRKSWFTRFIHWVTQASRQMFR